MCPFPGQANLSTPHGGHGVAIRDAAVRHCRELTSRWGEAVLKGMRYLIHDRDPLFTNEFRDILLGAGVKGIKLPAQSPDLNAFAERFVLSIKSECLNKIVPLGEGHLRSAVGEFLEHYHLERNHQGLDNQLITKPAMPANDNGAIVRRERLGGILNHYHRKAA